MSDQLTAKVRNYQGGNSFLLKMKETLKKYSSLTPKQRDAVEKIFNSQHSITNESLPENLKKIVEYKGDSKFINDIRDKFQKYGTLTDKQVSAASEAIYKELEPVKVIHPNLPTIGDTIKVGRKTGQGLKEKYNLQFNPILLDVTKILSVTPKAVKLLGKMTVKRGDICVCCAKTLTDEFSMLTKMGKLCAKHMGITYITDKSQAEKFREDYLKRVDEIGEMEFWIPLSQIKKWEGDAEMVLKMIRINSKPINFS